MDIAGPRWVAHLVGASGQCPSVRPFPPHHHHLPLFLKLKHLSVRINKPKKRMDIAGKHYV